MPSSQSPAIQFAPGVVRDEANTDGAILMSNETPNSDISALRIRLINDQPINAGGDFVLYWMIANRRVNWNYSLQRAVDWAKHLGKPLLVFEPLRCKYRWASDRLHHFVIQGMADNQLTLKKSSVSYLPYLETQPDAAKGLIESLASQSCLVITDDFPCFFLPKMVSNVGRRLTVRLESVDSNGILPMRQTDRVFSRAFDFRRHLQKTVKPFLLEAPKPNPVSRLKLPPLGQLPESIIHRWPAADVEALSNSAVNLRDFPIDHSVSAVETCGGSTEAQRVLKRFVQSRIARYCERNQPQQEIASGLSPYLHFGHMSAHQVFHEATSREDWTVAKTADTTTGSSTGWWGTSESLESFLDELITWREIGYNMCSKRNDFHRFESLPDWAQKTLNEHASDHRPFAYDLGEFESAKTHDPLWNAAQVQLLREGRIHNYLRMLWGKKILEWSEHPRYALATMIELNNKYALDGRNPSSYSGIFWVLGRYDRAWGPEREIFGKIRYMSSDNTTRKVRVKEYIQQYSPSSQPTLS